MHLKKGDLVTYTPLRRAAGVVIFHEKNPLRIIYTQFIAVVLDRDVFESTGDNWYIKILTSDGDTGWVLENMISLA